MKKQMDLEGEDIEGGLWGVVGLHTDHQITLEGRGRQGKEWQAIHGDREIRGKRGWREDG